MNVQSKVPYKIFYPLNNSVRTVLQYFVPPERCTEFDSLLH